jgi:signal peptidase I
VSDAAPEAAKVEGPEPEGSRGWRRFVRPALRWTERTLAVIGLLFVIYALCFDLSKIVTPSMSPTLLGGDGRPGDWVLTEKVSGWFSTPSRWEVITFKDALGTQLMKRVVGLPGEMVSLPDVGQLHINGKKLDCPEHLAFLQHLPAGNLVKGQSVATGEGWYVLGDHLRDSLDSRYEGPVLGQQLVGHAWLRVWPLSRFGVIR